MLKDCLFVGVFGIRCMGKKNWMNSETRMKEKWQGNHSTAVAFYFLKKLGVGYRSKQRSAGGLRMKKKIWPYVVGFMTILLCQSYPTNSWALSSFRCGDQIVSEGDTKSIVRFKCGPPSDAEERSYTSSRRNDRYSSRGETYIYNENWYYNCGEGDWIYQLIFDGDRLFEIKSVERGFGNSKCMSGEDRQRQE